MTPEERAAVDAALREVYEHTLNPYGTVNAALARYEQQQKAEWQWWTQFLPGNSGSGSTQVIDPPGPRQLRIRYAPDPTGPLGPGEIVRTWTPPVGDLAATYGEVLLVGESTGDRLYGFRLTTTSHRGPQHYFAVGAGPRSDHGRFPWVDLDHLLSVHAAGVRRPGFTIDRPRFVRIADELYRRYLWPMDDEDGQIVPER